MTAVSPIELNGRLSALMEQRNEALDRLAVTTGQLVAARHRVAELEKRVAELKPSDGDAK